MRIIDFSVKRRVTVTMVAVAVVLFGVVAFTRLPINLLPDISYPSLTIETRYPGAAPGEVEAIVSRPVEEVVGVVAGVRRLTSVSRPGLSQVVLEFDWGREMDFAALDVRQKLDLVRLPKEAGKPILLRFDPANDPIVRLFVTGADNLFQLRYVAEEILKKDLESTDGVAAINVNGGFEDEIRVKIDEGKLALVGLTIANVNQTLARENINQAGGSLYEEEARYLVRAQNEFQGLDDIRETVLTVNDGRNVRLGDLAVVTRTSKQREVITRFAGKEAVELALYKEGDANTVSVARAIRNRLENVKGELPEGIEVHWGADQSRFIEASIKEVLLNAAVGGFFAIIVLLLFLKDLRSTLIIGVSIPISIVATFFLMFRTGTSLNIMSLGGLALGVGMLVDNAIVVLESIYKKKEEGMSSLDSARAGASDVGRAVIASTLTTVAVFLPVVFLEGIAAQLFLDQALTVSFSLLASLAVALTLIPMVAALILRGPADRVEQVEARREEVYVDTNDEEIGRIRRFFRATRRFFRIVFLPVVWLWRFLSGFLPVVLLKLGRVIFRTVYRVLAFVSRPVTWLFDSVMDRVSRAYPVILDASLRSRGMVVTSVLVLFGVTLVMIPRLGLNLIPQFSQGEFSFAVELPEGTPLESTDRFVAEVQSVLEGDARVGGFSSIAGGAGLSLSNTGTEGENSARIQIKMAEGTTPVDEENVIELVRTKLASSEAARFKFERPSYFSFRTPIEVEIFSDSLPELHEAAIAIKAEINGIPGLVDVKSSSELGNPELQVRFNRDQLTSLGLNLFDVAETVRSKVQGSVATRFTEGDREIDILVRSVEMGTASVSDVTGMIIGQIDGRPIYLNSVAEITLTEGPSEIRRIGQKRAALVSGNLDGRNMGAVAADIRESIKGLSLPAGVTAVLSGQEEEMARSLQSLVFAMALAIFLVYLVMASQFESFVHPFVIIFTLPLGAIGVVGALAITGKTIDVVAMIGAVMLAGIVVNNGIVLIDAVNQRREDGLSKHDALIKAGSDRLRPILMTSLTTILGLLPMAMGVGEGAELRSPLAITVIGGLAVATALTLIVIPVVYSLLDRKLYAADLATQTVPGVTGSVMFPDRSPEVVR